MIIVSILQVCCSLWHQEHDILMVPLLVQLMIIIKVMLFPKRIYPCSNVVFSSVHAGSVLVLFSFQNDCQFLPFKVKAKQDKMDDPKKHEYKYLLCNFILSILPLLFSLKTSFLSAVFLSSISCSNI